MQLMKEIELSLGREFGSFDSFHDFFRFLVSLNAPIMVVLDEYNELKESYGGVQTDSMMRRLSVALWERMSVLSFQGLPSRLCLYRRI